MVKLSTNHIVLARDAFGVPNARGVPNHIVLHAMHSVFLMPGESQITLYWHAMHSVFLMPGESQIIVFSTTAGQGIEQPGYKAYQYDPVFKVQTRVQGISV